MNPLVEPQVLTKVHIETIIQSSGIGQDRLAYQKMDRVITFLTVLLSEVLDHHTTIIETQLSY